MTAVPFPARRVLLGVTGSVAAAEAPGVVVALRQLCGVEVKVVMTTAAASFVSPTVLAVASGHPVVTDENFRAPSPEVPHVALTEWADLLLVLPATADVLGKAAHGLATDALTTCVLAAPCPVAFVPSMNGAMWRKPAVQRNVEVLRADGHGVVPPVRAFSLGSRTFDEGGMAALPDVLTWLGNWLGTERGEHVGVG